MSFPGCARAKAISSFTELIGTDGCSTTSIDCALVCVIAIRSFTGS